MGIPIPVIWPLDMDASDFSMQIPMIFFFDTHWKIYGCQILLVERLEDWKISTLWKEIHCWTQMITIGIQLFVT